MMYRAMTALVMTLAAGAAAHAEDATTAGPAADASATAPEVSSEGDGAISVHGGESTVAELSRDREPLSELSEALRPWYEWKQGIRERTGLDFAFSYAALYQRASRSGESGDRDAAAGIARFYGTWTLLGQGTKNTGDFVYRVEHRHKLGTSLTPTDLGGDAGSITATARTFSDFQWGATIAYWRQRLLDGRLVLLAGRVDPTDYFDMYALNSSQSHFMNKAFASPLPAAEAPSFGFGAAAGAMLADEVYALAGFSDATGSATQSRWSEVRHDKEWFKHAEIGWTPSPDRVSKDNVHLAYWRMDRRSDPGLSSNWGLTLSGSIEMDDGFIPFARAGFARDDTTAVDRTVTIGAGQKFGEDLLGVGLSWSRPSDHGLDDQTTAEVFYNIELADNVNLTPDIQLVIDPALDPDNDSLWIVGLRLRITF